ncbi:MAG: BatA domain-containing protein [Bacteroidota bacterium]|nr:BatA domain-containing protein [Bacteroidota bacterium]
MSFLHPAFLWALTALAIPVFIHLFQLRRFKRIDFPNVRFLAEVSQQTRARKKIQHWLVLIARLLAITCLVLAFAQPFIPSSNTNVGTGQRGVSVYIDDSFSMDGQNARGRLLDQARRGAQEAVMAHGPGDRFQILTGRFEGRQQIMLGRDEALEAAAQVDVGSFSRLLSHVVLRQREALAGSDAPVKRSFLFTDLQRSITDVENWKNASLIPTVIVPIASSQVNNLSIDSVWFASPVRRAGQNEQLYVRVRNHGEQDLVNVPLRLTINGRQRALATFGVEGGATVDTSLRFITEQTGNHWGEVALNDHPVVFDDRLHIGYRVIERLRVLLVSGGDPVTDRLIGSVFRGDSVHTYEEQAYRAIDLSALDRQDLVILNGLPDISTGIQNALAAFVEGGGSLAIFPPSGGDPSNYAPLFGQFNVAAPARMDTSTMRVERIDLEHPFYRDIFQTMPRNVDLPLVSERWSLRPPPGSDVLLRTQDGSAYFASIDHGNGSVLISATPLAEKSGTLTRHALFATSLLRMAELSRPMGTLYHTIGDDAVITIEGLEISGDRPPRLSGPNGVEFVPEIRRQLNNVGLVLHDQDLPEGAYALVQEMDTIAMIAMNFPRRESDLTAFTAAQLEQELAQRGLTTFSVMDSGIEDLSLRLSELDQGRKLWKWFVLLALIFLVIEVLLLRFR